MNMLVFCGLNDSKVKAKLLPMINSSHINSIYLIRDTPIDLRKVNCFFIPKYLFFPMFKIIYKFFFGLYCFVTKRVDIILGIYLVPHGILSLLVGKIMGRKTFLSMIGTDVNQELPNSRILQFLSNRNDVITVTGSKTENFLIDLGFPKNKIAVISSYVEVDKPKLISDDDLYPLYDDLNTPGAIGVFFSFISEMNKKIAENTINDADKEKSLVFLKLFNSIFDILDFNNLHDQNIPKELQDLLVSRQEARKNLDWKLSDSIRDKIESLGWQVEDTSSGQNLSKKK